MNNAMHRTTLAALCRLVTDGTHDSPKLIETGVPFIKGKHISGGRIDFASCDYISHEDHLTVIARSNPERGDTLFSNIGSVGDAAFVDTDQEFSIKNVALFKPDSSKIDQKYLFYLLRSDGVRNEMLAARSGSAQPFISLGALRSHQVNVHSSMETQRRIASILGAYDDLIEVNRRRIAVLEEMARGLFEEWFVRFCFPGHEAVPILETPDGPLPEGWSFEPLGILADIQWGDTSKTKKAYTPDGYRAYSASGPDGYMSYYDFDRTGVVLSAIGAKCGKTWLARGQWSCIKNTMRFWARDGHVSTEYLFLALSDPERWPRRGAAQPFISLGDARKIKLIRPDLPTSTRFEAMASSTLELADNLRDQDERLATSRDLLLPRLISGQLSVAEAERQLEEAA